jgi:NAD+ synthase
VDSACTLEIATRALGKDKVLALLMPHSDYSSEQNLSDAQELVKKNQVEYRQLEISQFTKSFFELEFSQSALAKANLMSRIRMCLLYYAANFANGLVLGTSNKTELMLGFFTKYGDGGVDVEVLGELYKTEVFALARYFGLEKFATKRPTAEIFAGHFDEEEIGLSYSEIDPILQVMEANPVFSPRTKAEKIVTNWTEKAKHKLELPLIISRR